MLVRYLNEQVGSKRAAAGQFPHRKRFSKGPRVLPEKRAKKSSISPVTTTKAHCKRWAFDCRQRPILERSRGAIEGPVDIGREMHKLRGYLEYRNGWAHSSPAV